MLGRMGLGRCGRRRRGSGHGLEAPGLRELPRAASPPASASVEAGAGPAPLAGQLGAWRRLAVGAGRLSRRRRLWAVLGRWLGEVKRRGLS